MSYARQSLKIVQEFLYGRKAVEGLKAKMQDVEKLVNDLLQYIDTAMFNLRKVKFKKSYALKAP